MVKNEDVTAAYVTPVRSPWDGGLVQQFRTWGYREIENRRSELCDFGPDQHNLQRAFAELEIGTASSADGGPNHCFYVEHKYGPTVQRPSSGKWPEPNQQYYMVGPKRYRETEAYSIIGINLDAGAAYFLNRLSPAKAAKDNWDVPEVRKEWLPALASSLDHAWAFWNRANAGHLSGIEKIFSCMITNEITLALVDEALRSYPLGPGEVRPRGVEKWPGNTFPVRYHAAQALLGSPNGLGVGYFLAQHKHKLGNKSVERTTVFRPDKGMMPYLLFWIEDAPFAKRSHPPTVNKNALRSMLVLTPISGPFDGDLRDALHHWGYTEIPVQGHLCDFDLTHHLSVAFRALDVDPRSAKRGGPNRCFHVEHRYTDSPAPVKEQGAELPFEQRTAGVQTWPGTTFSVDDVKGQALLGSPNEIASGFFLAQHKQQLGGNRVIDKITVFRSEQYGSLPNLLSWVV
ncbi:hypothetical protein N0V86_006306 [Didymella sp. IMI 355093]|nr:hypothetical protein N0V86_006306 [Didymella sp. IMI 355093]